jgi:hypothetical protein
MATVALANKSAAIAVDIPDRFELFLLDEGEKKVTVAPDSRKFFLALSLRIIATNATQASQTPPSSPSTRKTTPSAIY